MHVVWFGTTRITSHQGRRKVSYEQPIRTAWQSSNTLAAFPIGEVAAARREPLNLESQPPQRIDCSIRLDLRCRGQSQDVGELFFAVLQIVERVAKLEIWKAVRLRYDDGCELLQAFVGVVGSWIIGVSNLTQAPNIVGSRFRFRGCCGGALILVVNESGSPKNIG